jgi:hypothetical protein
MLKRNIEELMQETPNLFVQGRSYTLNKKENIVLLQVLNDQ